MAPILINTAARITIARHGEEAQPVMVIDDVLAAPDRWIEQAALADFTPIGPYYPGIRSVVPADAARLLAAELAPIVAATFGTAPPLFECYLSIVTTPPAALSPIQRLPHIDGVERDRIAILIFLAGTTGSGTSFYRQRATGYETVDAARFPAFDAALTAGIAEHGVPAATYIGDDSPLFERIATYDAAPNRALIYHSNALHCAAIAPGAGFGTDPKDGARLTNNAFLFDDRSGGAG